jgi:hypothetical protein
MANALGVSPYTLVLIILLNLKRIKLVRFVSHLDFWY